MSVVAKCPRFMDGRINKPMIYNRFSIIGNTTCFGGVTSTADAMSRQTCIVLCRGRRVSCSVAADMCRVALWQACVVLCRGRRV